MCYRPQYSWPIGKPSRTLLCPVLIEPCRTSSNKSMRLLWKEQKKVCPNSRPIFSTQYFCCCIFVEFFLHLEYHFNFIWKTLCVYNRLHLMYIIYMLDYLLDKINGTRTFTITCSVVWLSFLKQKLMFLRNVFQILIEWIKRRTCAVMLCVYCNCFLIILINNKDSCTCTVLWFFCFLSHQTSRHSFEWDPWEAYGSAWPNHCPAA